MAGITALAARAGLLRAESPREVEQPDRLNRFVFVGVAGDKPGVHAYAIDGRAWELRQVIHSEAPVSLALHPSGESLYVLNGAKEYRGLACGSVEAYGVNCVTGELDLLGREGLSLSATMPRHLAVAPDGKALVVAVDGGGAYNRLPILADGRVGRVSGIVKETGCGPVAEHQEAAHPQMVLFDGTGKRVITADLGCDRVSVLSVKDGMEVLARHEMPAGSGPRHLALHPDGRLLYVAHGLDDTLACFGYDAREGKIAKQLWRVHGEYVDTLAMHPAGGFLYVAGGGAVKARRIETATGGLRTTHSQSVGGLGRIDGMTVRPDERGLIAVTTLGVAEIGLEAIGGRLEKPVLAASLSGVRSIAML
jgi:6-phosphogluconolactonase (cycloisomerase 2 family)